MMLGVVLIFPSAYFGYKSVKLYNQRDPEAIEQEKQAFKSSKLEQSKSDKLSFKEEQKELYKQEKAARKRQKKLNKAGMFYRGVKCPKCKSTNVEFMQNDRKGFSIGKSGAGGLIAGPVGILVGFAGKKGKNMYHCKDCGRTFK
ncbi:hypothetical protein V6O07_11950, partial [Arthrospira platensis SPKY2]